MNWYAEFGPGQSQSFDIFAIASSATDLRPRSILDYPTQPESRETMPSHTSIDSKLLVGYAYSRQLSYIISTLIQKYSLQERLSWLRNSIELLFFEEESSSRLIEGDVYILERIKNLIENGRVLDARHFLSSIPFEISDRVDNWKRVLARPKLRPEESGTGADLRNDALWLRNNSDKYKGNWVALNQGSFLGSHESRVELHRMLKHAGKIHGAMFFKIEKD